MRLLFNLLLAACSPKTLLSVGLALVLTPIWGLVERYLFDDWQFLGSLCVLIMVDTVFGVQHHWRQHTISSWAFSRIFTKASIYLGLLVLTHTLTTYQVHGHPQVLFAWFDTFMYSCMMAREAVSILEHIAGMEPRLVPRALLKRLALISDEGVEAAMTAMPAAQHSEAPLHLGPPAPAAGAAPAEEVATPDVSVSPSLSRYDSC